MILILQMRHRIPAEVIRHLLKITQLGIVPGKLREDIALTPRSPLGRKPDKEDLGRSSHSSGSLCLWGTWNPGKGLAQVIQQDGSKSSSRESSEANTQARALQDGRGCG